VKKADVATSDPSFTLNRSLLAVRPLAWRRYARPTFLCLLAVASLFPLVFPILWMLLSAFKPLNELVAVPPSWLPRHPTLQHFRELISLTSFPVYLWNSTVAALLTSAITVVVALLGAYSLTRFQYRGRRFLANFTLVSYMFPPILLAIPIFVIISRLGLADSLVSLALAHISFALPFCLWLMWGYMKTVPIALEEAAMIDGASRMGAFARVVVPMSLPGVIAIGVLSFLVSWNDYLYALILLTSEGRKTLSLGVSTFLGSMGVEWGLINAAGVLITVPVILVFGVVQRFLIQGFGAGGVKE
jgi:ABC-type glycerol-3-phosphate transport system permease component